MHEPVIEVDYLIRGAGAAGMAFADSLVHESEATIAIVDRNHRPGGHWNHAYPFVRLHQPSAFYGVNSRPLGSGAKDEVG
jgi:cation diffusion facilitator CzcD-associated flavoprotein CzcO